MPSARGRDQEARRTGGGVARALPAGSRVTADVGLAVVFSLLLTMLALWHPTPARAHDCADVIFVGVRGSGEKESDFGGNGETVERIRQTFHEGLSAKRSVAFEHLDYPAMGTGWLAVPGGASSFLDGVYSGADWLEWNLKDITAKCNSWIVLGGYSQGALVIRRALTQGLPTNVQNRIAGVALMADPARHSTGDGLQHYGGAPDSGTHGVYEEVLGSRVTPLPAVRGLAASWCLPDDPVCAYTPGRLAMLKLNQSHFKYKNNGMARIAGYWLAEDLLKLPSRPVAQATTPPANPAPPQRPRVPDGNYVSTCNLKGASHCAGVYLRSKPLWPDHKIGTLPNMTPVTLICGISGTSLRDDIGHTSNWWFWVRTSDGREGYVSWLFVFGPSVRPPNCSPTLDTAGSTDLTGSLRQEGSVRFTYPIRNDSPLPVGINTMIVSVRGPGGQVLDVPCAGGTSLTLGPGQAWTCTADLVLPFRGNYRATLAWQWADGAWTDGTPHWNVPWTWDMTIAGGPLEGVSSRIDGDGTLVGSTSTGSATVRNATNRHLTFPTLAHQLRRPSGEVSTVTCGTNVSLAPGETFECRSALDFRDPGDYSAWFAYRLPNGEWDAGPRLFVPDWSFWIARPVPVLQLAGYSVNTPAVAQSPLEVEFTLRNAGSVPVSFYPQLLSTPTIYGGFGGCDGINYSPTTPAEWLSNAVTLQPGETYRCVTHEVLPTSAVGSHALSAWALGVSDDTGSTPNFEFPLRTITVKPRPPARKAVPPPAPPTARKLPTPPAPVRVVPRGPKVTARVKAVAGKRRLFVDVNPNRGKGFWTFKVLHRKKNGKWAPYRRTFRTQGARETRILDLPKGTYRVVVKPRGGYRGTVSARVRLAR